MGYDNLICSYNNLIWPSSRGALIYNIKNNTISQPIDGYNFIKYYFKDTKYLFYKYSDKCIKAYKKG